MNLGAFSIISIVEGNDKGLAFSDYRGLATTHPWLSMFMVLFMLSLAGFPPTAGFIAKYGLLSAAVANGSIWLVVIAVLNTLLSAYYYLRLIVNMYMKSEENAEKMIFPFINKVFIGLLAFMMLLLGINPGFLLDITGSAAIAVF
jgi:NADH-quinone oxidoreductase subunit N